MCTKKDTLRDKTLQSRYSRNNCSAFNRLMANPVNFLPRVANRTAKKFNENHQSVAKYLPQVTVLKACICSSQLDFVNVLESF